MKNVVSRRIPLRKKTHVDVHVWKSHWVWNHCRKMRCHEWKVVVIKRIRHVHSFTLLSRVRETLINLSETKKWKSRRRKLKIWSGNENTKCRGVKNNMYTPVCGFHDIPRDHTRNVHHRERNTRNLPHSPIFEEYRKLLPWALEQTEFREPLSLQGKSCSSVDNKACDPVKTKKWQW